MGRAKHEVVMFLHHNATDEPKRRSQGWLCVLSSPSFSSPLVLLLPPVLRIGIVVRVLLLSTKHQAGPDEVRAASCPEEQGLQLAAECTWITSGRRFSPHDSSKAMLIDVSKHRVRRHYLVPYPLLHFPPPLSLMLYLATLTV